MVQVVDDECVGVAPVPVQVRVRRIEVGMGMLDHVGIGRRPEPGRRGDARQRQAPRMANVTGIPRDAPSHPANG